MFSLLVAYKIQSTGIKKIMLSAGSPKAFISIVMMVMPACGIPDTPKVEMVTMKLKKLIGKIVDMQRGS